MKTKYLTKYLKGGGLCLAAGSALGAGLYTISIGLAIAGFTILLTEE